MTRSSPGLAMAALAGLLLAPPAARAEWRIEAGSHFFYTDDAALFSSTRRFRKDEDPTQPVIDFDLAQQGSDFVYEPTLEIEKTLPLLGQSTTLRAGAHGFVFGVNPRFNHASVGAEGRRPLAPGLEAFARYLYIGSLFLGDNEIRTPGGGEEEDPPTAKEELDTHFWALALRYEVSERISGTLLGRAGIRRYEPPFEHRNMNFFTGGLHVAFELGERVDLTLGFHYERGLADGRNGRQRLLQDDISYNNYFATTELEVEVASRLDLALALDFEHNDFTTDIVGDERNGEHENQFQGDIELIYELTDAVDLTAGFQGVYRKESFEDALRNLNTGLGIQVSF
ncbi:MAG: hypothetical protein ACR2P8_00040 [Myxococcota bacterium]